MGRPRKKVILFIVEGQSDLEALERPISSYVQGLSPEVDVYFYKARTDVTSDNRNNPDNIVYCLNKYYLDDFFSETGYIYPKDIVEVVQITDLDGTFVSDENCRMFTPEIFAEDGFVYEPPFIYGPSAEAVIARNETKAANLSFLSSQTTIKIKSKTIPYCIYYFSSSIDHFLYDKPNGTQAEKIDRAEQFADEIENNGIDIVQYFAHHPHSFKGEDYAASWEYAKTENHSIDRGTNLNLYLNSLKEKVQRWVGK